MQMRLLFKPLPLFLLAVLFFACGTWSLPLIDRDEPRFAEASREMRERGDWIVPYFNNGYRFDKPPLTYWAQVSAYRIFGENDFAARLPSVLAAALTVLAVFGFAQRLYGTAAGGSAALIFMTCLQTFMHAKGAVADMLMVLFFTLAMWAAWELFALQKNPVTSRREQWGWWLAFYVSLALGFLAKGPVAWLPLGAVGLFAWLRPREAATGKRNPFRFGLGVLLMLALVGAWGIPALIQTHGEFFKVGIGKHVVGRSFTTMEGHGSGGLLSYLLTLPLYFITVFVSFFPWSIRLPWLARRLRAQRALQGEQLFLLLGISLVFGVFTLVRTKLPHYTLPAFPLLAILLAGQASTLSGEPGESGCAPFVKRYAGWTLGVCTAVSLFLFPVAARWFPGHELILKSAGALTPEMEFASTEYQEPSLVWYARGHVHGWYSPMSAKKLPAFMAKPGPRFCVAPAGTLQPAADWKVFETAGFNVVHWKPVKLELTVKPR